MSRIMPFIVLLILAAGAQAAVYKCQDAKGRTLYSGTPCGDNSETITIQQGPEGAQGLRESEKAFMEETQKRREEREAAEAEAAAHRPRTGYACKGIYIASFTPYNQDRIYGTGLGTGSLVSERCVQVVLKLSGYGGQLGTQSFLNALVSRFIATLSNGVQVRAQRGWLSEEGRISRAENYTGEFCFGNSRFAVVDLKCE